MNHERIYAILEKMHKFLLTLLLLVIFLFPNSEAFAAAACPTGTNPECPSGTVARGDTCIGREDIPVDPVRCTPVGQLPLPYVCKEGGLRGDIDKFCNKSSEEQRIVGGICYCVDKSIPPDKTEEALKGTYINPHSCSNDTKICTSAKAVPCPDGLPGIMTAIGCVPTEPKALVEGLLKYGTLAAGGIAFLIMIIASLQLITAEGNPEIIKSAQERFYSAIIGLLLIIFAVLLMQVIGFDILGLPGFGK